MFRQRPLEGNLTLENDGYLSLFPIGTGSAFSKSLFQNNLLIVKGKDHILIDCGTRTPEAFYRLGLPITEVKNFCITHSHADHIGGLEEVILMGRYVSRHKPNIYISSNYEKILWSQSLKGGAQLNERKGTKSLEFTDYWEVKRPRKVGGFDRETIRFKVGSIDIHAFRTKHFPDNAMSWADSAYSLGLIIDGRILFTGDTRFDPELIHEFTEKFPIELILHDVQFFPGGVHAPFDDLKTLPEVIKEKTLLMHYPDTYHNHATKVKEAGFAGFLSQQTFYDFK